MGKIAVFFPGIGHSLDRPLLYYARRQMQKAGFEILGVTYDGIDVSNISEVLKNKDKYSLDIYGKTLTAFSAAAVQKTIKALASKKLQECDQVVFVGKSVGCVVAGLVAKNLNIRPNFVFITPLEVAHKTLESDKPEKDIVFAGRQDNIAAFSVVEASCRKLGVELHDFEGANHSLETGDLDKDIKYLGKYVSLLASYTAEIDKAGAAKHGIYDCSVLTRNKTPRQLRDYAGKVLLIVNTATGCGFTPQYEKLEAIYKRFNDKGLEILDFPCNQFENQAPGSSEEIYSFCTARYSITFEQFAKIEVNGAGEHELYTILKTEQGFAGFNMETMDGRFLDKKLRDENPDYDKSSDIKWNFTKFLVDRSGRVVRRFEPDASLEELEKIIETYI